MSASIEHQQRVFLAYRPLFKDEFSRIRKLKAIRARVKATLPSQSIIVESLGIKQVAVILKSLLVRKVFESDEYAQQIFPQLFETSPEQDAQHEASDAGAARLEAEAFSEVEAGPVTGFEGPIDGPSHVESALVVGSSSRTEESTITLPSPQCGKTEAPSLYPIPMPLHLQHEILCEVQKLLEECCFDFTKKHDPKMMEKQWWDCTEAIELDKWTLKYRKRSGLMSSLPFKTVGSDLPTVLSQVNRIRHAAVHRLRVSAKGLCIMIQDAITFAEALDDPIRVSLLHAIMDEVNNAIRSQELSKNYLESKLKLELDDISQKRKELDKREQEAIQAMLSEDNENTAFVSVLLKSSFQELLNGHRAAKYCFADTRETQAECADEGIQESLDEDNRLLASRAAGLVYQSIWAGMRWIKSL